MQIQNINNSQKYTAFKQLKIDPETNEILKPIRRQLNSLVGEGRDVVIKKFKGTVGDYTDYGIIINISGRDVKSKNPVKAYINKLAGANYPAVSTVVAKKCIMNENGNQEILFEADNDLMRTRTYKSLKNAIEEHNILQYSKITKFRPVFDKMLLFLNK